MSDFVWSVRRLPSCEESDRSDARPASRAGRQVIEVERVALDVLATGQVIGRLKPPDR